MNNNGYGVRVYHAEWNTVIDTRFINSVIANNEEGGVFLSQSVHIKVFGSFINSTIAYNNSYGIRFEPTDYGGIDIVNSIIWGHSNNLTGIPTANVAYSDIGDAEYFNINNNIWAEPRFVSPGLGDYHVKPTSPVIDAGLDTHPDLPVTDFEGDPRLAGAGVDIGADEFIVQEVITGLTLANDGPTLLGQLTTFSATITSGNNVAYEWDFGDGSGGTGPLQTHTYQNVGVYTAQVMVTNNSSLATGTTIVQVLPGLPVSGGTITPTSQVSIKTGTGVFSETVLFDFELQPVTSTGTLEDIGLFYELDAFYQSSGLPAQPQPGKQYTITLNYKQKDVPTGVDEADLALYHWNSDGWIKETSSKVNIDTNTIRATPDHFSLWAVLAPPTVPDDQQKIFLPVIMRK
jgi:hypothetical protein